MPERSSRLAVLLVGLAGLSFALGCSSSRGGAPAGAEPRASASPPARPAPSPSSPRESVRMHVTAGNDFLAHGLYDDAEREYRLALESEPGNLDALAGLGQVEVKRGDYSDAVPLLERATRVSTQMVSAFRALGDAYAALGDLQKASEAYRQAIALVPGDLDTRLSLARSLTEVGDYDEAAAICLAALREARGQPALTARVYRELGEAYSRHGKAPEAMSAYYRASELMPRDVETARGLAGSAVRAGLYAEAAAALGRLLEMAPLDLHAKKQLAWVNFKLDRFPMAIRDYESVRDSLGTVDRYYLAQAYAKSSKTDRAIELFREVVRLDPQNYKGVYCNMAYAYYDASRYQRAIEVAREGLRGDTASACLRYCWAQALDKLGRHDEAIPMFETVLTDPAYAEPARRELERQHRIIRLLKTKDRGN